MFEGCTEECAQPVPCTVCGRALPPRGRSVAPEMGLSSCCDRGRFELRNTRHIWSVDEIPAAVPEEEQP